LVDSEILTHRTPWLFRAGAKVLAQEAKYLPTDASRTLACRIPLFGFGAGQDQFLVLDRLDQDWRCPDDDGNWAALVLYFVGADSFFDRSDTNASNRRRNLERPLANLAAAPVWLVSGENRAGVNLAAGFFRPRAEWINA
jgi:hypothetical protein